MWNAPFILAILSAGLFVCCASASPVLTGVSQGGLSWTNDTAAGYYRVEWAPQGVGGLETNWMASWSGLVNQAAAQSNSRVYFRLPVYYRVIHATNAFAEGEPAAQNLTNGVVYPLSVWSSFSWPIIATGRVYTVDWLAGTNWAASWHDLCNIPATGLQMSCAVPMDFRLRAAWDANNSTNEDIVIDLGTNMVLVYGSGQVGPPGNTRFVSTRNFYMDECEVRVDQWNLVQAWAATNGYDLPQAGGPSKYPVNNVSWFDAIKYCNARSEASGMSPSYWQVDAFWGETNVYRTGTNDVTWIRTTNTFRLPTEAEWELAARGYEVGTNKPYAFYPWGGTNVSAIGPANANYWKSFDMSEIMGDQRTPVGGWTYIPAYIADMDPMNVMSNFDEYIRQQGYIVYPYPPSDNGLYDMAGGVAEWCWDRFQYYAYPPPEGSQASRGPSAGNRRVHRGGSWGVPGEKCTVFERGFERPDKRRANIGFRCVRN